MAALSPNRQSGAVKKRKRNDREKKLAAAKRKRKFDSTRIGLGKCWDEWERHRLICGFHSQIEFVSHLLAVHSRHCNVYTTIQSRYAANVESNLTATECENQGLYESLDIPQCSSTIDPFIDQFEYVPETPNTKTTRCMPLGKIQASPEWSTPGSIHPTKHGNELESLCGLPTTSTPKVQNGCQPRFELSDSDEDSEADTTLHEESDLYATHIDFEDPDWDSQMLDGGFDPVEEPDLKVSMKKEEAICASKCICFNISLDKLVQAAVGKNCRRVRCRKLLVFEQLTRGSCLLIKWRCPDDQKTMRHTTGIWSSQPRLLGMYAGNLLLPSSLLLSGNNYTKVALMAKFLNLGFVGERNFYRIQDKYVFPAVEEYWKKMQNTILQQTTTPLILAGDGRNDSPGHCAQYCTYSLMDITSKKIVAISIVDKRQTDLISVNMEKRGMVSALDEVLDKAQIAEVVTDAHPQIRALMKKNVKYQGIVHQFDIWHSSKNISKKIAAAGKEKGCKGVLPWIPSIRNHLWYCAQTCNGDADRLRENWVTCLHHVCNIHEWVDTLGYTEGKCSHPMPLEEGEHSKQWLSYESPAHDALYKVVWDKYFLPTLPYLKNFRHTTELELFHSHLLMYCPKRNSFKFTGYKVRNLLAVIDYNEHTDRPQAIGAADDLRHRGYYSKSTKRWSVSVLKQPKRYSYINNLLLDIVNKRELTDDRLDAPKVYHPDDARNICHTIAAVEKPTMDDMVASKRSRYSERLT